MMYLKPSVKIEPLVDRWSAWPHLLAPVQEAMNLAFRALPLIRSFVSSPEAHRDALLDPAMFGGPFVDLPINSTQLAEKYVVQMETDRAEAIKFAQDFRAFDIALRASAMGHSLDQFQRNLPPSLRGRVELVYSLSDAPKIRILEEMFQNDDLGLSHAEGVMLHEETDANRKFFLSTPRISPNDGPFIGRPFNSQEVLELCAARDNGVDLRAFADRVGIPVKTLAPYFTEHRTPSPCAPALAGHVRVRYFGHACILIETDEVSILVDPSCAWEPSATNEHFSYYDLPEKIDILLISHGHQDHLLPEVLMQIRHRVGVVLIPPPNRGELADPALRQILRRLGFGNIRVIDPLEKFDVPGGAITSLPFCGEHAGLDVHSKQCFLVEVLGRKICLLVDTDAVDPYVYDRLSESLTGLDVMFIGMECNGAPLSWMYGPLLSVPPSRRNDESRRLSGANSERAIDLVRKLRPRAAYVYAMGQEKWMRHIMGLEYTQDSIQLKEANAFLEHCAAEGISGELLYGKKDVRF
jgi:L-ascorbate metabolism protein UlaG (beta-lactamase superfamily)